MTEKLKERVDLRGLTCPEPVIRTKKLFDNPEVQAVEALVDDEVCVNNLQRLATSLKASCSVKKHDNYYSIVVERGGKSENQVQAHIHPTALDAAALIKSAGVGTVIFISKDTFGNGDEEFSRTLLNLFLQTTLESGLMPRAILMANSGVKLIGKDSPARKVLEDFKAKGCEVLACGLCVDYYKLKDEVPKEQITNMFAICEYLFAADKVIQP